ncbi:nuclear transport factor 2 family protein [Nocardioides bizhenqiangii]|uniref:Nuclear transport factor 2 family protein n=1 Tax=Nocardioides bizhenqiangii TaxID=3095076 RepID=A0ABZ0ZR57_9ACTN|nr:hypothetical protein [Nocardioides sp. HM61]WQQ26833.1 hypothetical protein SHK19_01040 [Nocardioides sp. HM61]
MRRLTGTAAPAIALLLTMTACSDSGDDGDAGGDEPSLGSPTTSVASVDDKAEIKAAVAAYDRALVTINREKEVTPEFTAVATETWADRLLTTYNDNVFSKGLVMVGRWRTMVETVKVDGDTAEADVCIDGNQVYVVEDGESVGSGAQSQGRFPGSISLVRDSGGWKVDGADSTEGSC